MKHKLNLDEKIKLFFLLQTQEIKRNIFCIKFKQAVSGYESMCLEMLIQKPDKFLHIQEIVMRIKNLDCFLHKLWVSIVGIDKRNLVEIEKTILKKETDVQYNFDDVLLRLKNYKSRLDKDPISYEKKLKLDILTLVKDL